MKLLNDTNTDLSNEMIVQLAIVLEMVLGAEIICYRCARSFDAINAKGIFFQEKKRSINNARKSIENCISQLEMGFDGMFEKVWNKIPGQQAKRCDAMQWLANDVIKLLLIYYSRADSDIEKRKRMQKALLNFKPDAETSFNLDEMLKYYNIE